MNVIWKKLILSSFYAAIIIFVFVFYNHTHSHIETEYVKRFRENQWKSFHSNILIIENNCNKECQNFKSSFLHWPIDKPKAVIYILTHDYSHRVTRLTNLLKSLDRYFNNRYNYPVVVFHEKDFEEFILHVRSLTNSSLYFQQVKFSLPSFLKDPVEENIPCTSNIGYRHMCRFQSKGVYEEVIFEDLDYYWRLDDDSLLTQPINYDLFKFMRDSNLLYGYIWEHYDARYCTTGLWEAAERYISQNMITTKFFKEWKRPKIYYNNFEISSFSIWRSNEYKKFINFIDHLGGIYYFRWGDAPVKGIAISMFLDRNQTHMFSDIAYRHASFNQIPET